MKVVLSPTSKISLLKIITFLREHWTKKEIEILKRDISNFKNQMRDGIVRHQKVDDLPNTYYTLIGNKQVKLYYEIKEETVLIKLFWSCKDNPQTLKKLLK